MKNERGVRVTSRRQVYSIRDLDFLLQGHASDLKPSL